MQVREAWSILSWTFFSFVAVFTVICVPVLLGVSVSILVPGEVGLQFNANLQIIEEGRGVYGSGRHWLGLGHSFVKFQSVVQQIRFHWPDNTGTKYDAPAINARTYDGLTVQMNIFIQYRIRTDEPGLLSLYYTLTPDFQATYVATASSICQDVAAKYVAFDLVYQRDAVSNAMLTALNSEFYNTKFATILNVEVMNINLPDDVANMITQTVVAEQDVLQAGHEYNIATISAQTNVLQSKIVSQTILLQANSSVVVTLYTASTQAQQLIIKRTAEAEAYGSVLTKFQGVFGTDEGTGYTSADLLSYIWTQNVQNTGANATLGFEMPSMLQ